MPGASSRAIQILTAEGRRAAARAFLTSAATTLRTLRHPAALIRCYVLDALLTETSHDTSTIYTPRRSTAARDSGGGMRGRANRSSRDPR